MMLNYFVDVRLTVYMVVVSGLVDVDTIKFSNGAERIQGESHLFLEFASPFIAYVRVFVTYNKVINNSDN